MLVGRCPGVAGGAAVGEMVGQPVLDAVGDLLPVLRERAQETEDARAVPAEIGQGAGGGRVLPAAAAGQVRRAGGRPADVLPGRADDRQRVRLDRLGRLGRRRAPLAARAVPGGRAGGGLGRGHQHQDVVVLRADRPGPGRRGRAPAERPLELLLRLRPRDAGCCSAGSSPTTTGNPVDFRTFLLPASDYQIDDVWDTVGLRGTGSNDIVVDGAFVPEHRSLSFADVTKCVCPGQEVNDGAAVPDPVRLDLLLRDHHADHRHGDRRLPGARGLSAHQGQRRLRRAQGRRGPVRPGRGSPRRRPRSTRPGSRSSAT